MLGKFFLGYTFVWYGFARQFGLSAGQWSHSLRRDCYNCPSWEIMFFSTSLNEMIKIEVKVYSITLKWERQEQEKKRRQLRHHHHRNLCLKHQPESQTYHASSSHLTLGYKTPHTIDRAPGQQTAGLIVMGNNKGEIQVETHLADQTTESQHRGNRQNKETKDESSAIPTSHSDQAMLAPALRAFPSTVIQKTWHSICLWRPYMVFPCLFTFWVKNNLPCCPFLLPLRSFISSAILFIQILLCEHHTNY